MNLAFALRWQSFAAAWPALMRYCVAGTRPSRHSEGLKQRSFKKSIPVFILQRSPEFPEMFGNLGGAARMGSVCADDFVQRPTICTATCTATTRLTTMLLRDLWRSRNSIKAGASDAAMPLPSPMPS